MMNNFLVMEIFKEKGYKTVNFLTTDFEVNADISLCKNNHEVNELTETLGNINIFN